MPSSSRRFFGLVLLGGWSLMQGSRAVDAQEGKAKAGIFARDNLVAWCIVPFDGKKRGPEERARMLNDLGIRRLAYDYRAEHVPTFDAEMAALKKHGIELTAWWFPTTLNAEARTILAVLQRHGLMTQLWVTGGGAPTKTPEEQQARVRAEAARIRPIAQAAADIGCTVALYNHGGWFGEPENQLAILRELKLPNVGLVYNLHHGHEHLDRFPELLRLMRPHLLALNLNGMVRGGERKGMKILPLGAGDLDLSLLKTIRDSGYAGPIGILNHTDHDAEARLRDNLDGLRWLLPQLDGKPAGPRPQWRTWASGKSSPAAGSSSAQGQLFEGKPEYRQAPLTIECRVTLYRPENYNILVASDTKRSGAHWEIFSMRGTGKLTVYVPGRKPDHVHTEAFLCDGRPHQIALHLDQERIRLFLDGRKVADQAGVELGRPVVPGGLGIGRLVEGTLGCSGEVHWVRIRKGIHPIPAQPAANVAMDDATVGLWQFAEQVPATVETPKAAPPYDAKLAARLAAEAEKSGDARRGAQVFAATTSACLSCHRIGKHGGSVGPDLCAVGKEKDALQIVESLLWPKREVKPEYVSHVVATADGRLHQGYKVREDGKVLVLRDPSNGKTTTIRIADIEARKDAGTLMPEGLTQAMSHQQQRDLVRFLSGLGRPDGLALEEVERILESAGTHVAAKFAFDRAPLDPKSWPHWKHPVNRDRLYDFYAREADHFRAVEPVPHLLPEFPGLDGGTLGHWGNQNEQAWADDRWNQTLLGSVQCGIFRGAGRTVPRGVCLRLGDKGELSVCFDPDTLTYPVLWQDGFVRFSSVRHGFMHGLQLDGKPLPAPEGKKPEQPFRYLGFHRHGKRVIFAYRIGDTEYLDAPWVENGKFTRVVGPAKGHPLEKLSRGGPAQWPQELRTALTFGSGRPYAVDTIGLPFDNPWKALLFCGGHDFLPDGSALVCTIQGDVWRVSGLDSGDPRKGKPGTAVWRRFASGLNHALGLHIDKDGIFVQGRDQITRLHDLDGDGEADFHECFSNAFQTSPAGHDFICGLERDEKGRFYTASGNQGLVRVSSDGRQAEVLATGFRNPDGLGLMPNGVVTVPCSEGDWTPASMICAVRPGKSPLLKAGNFAIGGHHPPFFGYRGLKDGRGPDLPLVYLPRGLDNSSGGQVRITSKRWGPLEDRMLHLSFGMGAHFLLLRDEVAGQLQGAIMPLPGEFLSGAHRGRFNPVDGQLYVSGMQGWGSYTPHDGCFQRVRYAGDPVQLPTGFHVHRNGVVVRFSRLLDRALVGAARNHFAQCWNYRYSGAYGSPEFSARHPGTRGHDPVRIASAHVLSDGQSLFLEMPDLQPVNVLHLRLRTGTEEKRDLFVTVHRLDEPFTDFPGYAPGERTVAAHPIFADLALATLRVPNPWRRKIAGARNIRLETGKNLSYATRTLHAKAGEKLHLTLVNPDVVPHNWVLARPGTLEKVGLLANQLVADPEAAARQYVPRTEDVLVHTDVVDPGTRSDIYFQAPTRPGRYPFLCTFPGHWMVMNGTLVVE